MSSPVASPEPARAEPPAAADSASAGAAPRAARLDRIQHAGKSSYLSGFNLAWLDFARDVGRGLDAPRLRRALLELTEAGGNTIRWWIHTDGSLTPTWQGPGEERRVVGLGESFLADLASALDIAAERGVYVLPCLWSFDMLRDDDFRKPPTRDNYRLLTEDAVLQSYIDTALVPMVHALAGHPALIAWELFNEPENMTEPWFRKEPAFYGGPVPTLQQLQRTQAKMAAAIHRAALDQGHVALVTTGSKSLGKYNADVAGGSNLYRDDRMIAAAGGDEAATLDFFAPHYYDNEGKQGAWSPFHHPATYWQLSKPIVIGEFHALEALDVLAERVEAESLCQRLIDLGYAGGLAWQWNEHAAPIARCLRAAAPP